MSAPTRSDRELLAAHVAGDQLAFADLVRRHSDRLWAVALRVLNDHDEAADAVQETLLDAHRAAPRFRGECAVGSWLHGILVNRCRSRLRYARTRPTVPLQAGGPHDRGHHPQAGAADRMTVEDALGMLPPEQRLAVVLIDVQGYPAPAVALIMGVPLGTVRSRCARGRARLAVLLGHLAPDRDSRGVSTEPVAGSRRKP